MSFDLKGQQQKKVQFIEIESYGLDFYMTELEFYVEIEFIALDLTHQNRVQCARDVSFLNSFENVLTNKIV